MTLLPEVRRQLREAAERQAGIAGNVGAVAACPGPSRAAGRGFGSHISFRR